MTDLNRFIVAQEGIYDDALNEVRAGRKETHWMWFVFPQVGGLGMTMMSNYYGICDLEEAKRYLADDVLGFRLREISKAVLELNEADPKKIFGSIDAMKLRSSMTLFEMATDKEEDLVFGQVLDKFYEGVRDPLTISICNERKAAVKSIK